MSSIIKNIVGIFMISLWYVNYINAQWSSDFSEASLTDWTGDVDQFIINEDGQLQLNAPDAGETTLFRQSQISDDTISIGIYHMLDFSPSDNNRSTIYLALDNQDITIASGYYIQIGENGSDDALKFYYLNNGSAEQIGTATMGAMANEPAVVNIDIDVYPNGLWSIKTNYDGLESTSLDVEFMDDRFSFSDAQFFGIACKFSASRSDKFFYDDMFLKAFEVDRTPPTVIEATALSVNQILIKFDEPVEPSNALNINNYNVDNGVGNPSVVGLSGSLGNEYLLQFVSDFASDREYTMTASGINDLNGNLMADFSFMFNVPSRPIEGDLLLSEILFDPYIAGEDFIELYNTSDKFLELQGLVISNTQNEMMQIVTSNLSISPNGYIALTEDADFLVQEYKPDSDANISLSELPAFNNDAGNVTISTAEGVVLDFFDYTEDLHFQLIDDTEGVSLERISFEVETNDERNWQSASQNSRFATPGYKNSGEITINPGDEMFTVLTETFSPDQDGTDDLMVLRYNLDKSGFVANIAIHDAAGFKIKELSQNEFLSSQGIITWDGTNAEGNISDLGIYIVVGQIFHPDGDILNFKKTAVLAGFID
ncbi:MAG: hypothetical protein ACJATI_002630 [Halioglobus sp.]|jgi:hypothetical protein